MAGFTFMEHQTPLRENFRGNYRALVEDTNDPLQAGRIRARAYPMFANTAMIPTSHLPWAAQAAPCNHGAYASGVQGQDCGELWIPDVGTWVWMFFEGDDLYSPVYFAQAPALQVRKGTGGRETRVPDGPRLSREPDETINLRKARLSKNVPGPVTGTHWSEPDPAWAARYPYNRVRKTKMGLIDEYDDTSGRVRRHEYHPSGTNREINNTGNKTEHIVADEYHVVEGNSYRHVKGNVMEKVDGNVSVLIGGDLTLAVAGSAAIKITGNFRLRVLQGTRIEGVGNQEIVCQAIQLVGTTGSATQFVAALGAGITSINPTTPPDPDTLVTPGPLENM